MAVRQSECEVTGMLCVKDFREERGLMVRDIVEVMQEHYPKYDKHLHSKVERPEEYGIRLVNDAERLIEEAYASTSPKSRKRDCRKLPQRVQCRISKADYERLQQALKRKGYETIQAGLRDLIIMFLEGEESNGMVFDAAS